MSVTVSSTALASSPAVTPTGCGEFQFEVVNWRLLGETVTPAPPTVTVTLPVGASVSSTV